MLLSIGLIMKNEEKYLERCLTALQPILEQVDSELIIADTGSTDNSMEIAKKFTDNVFSFEWINDFAAARNSTLERSKGEWYMFIDPDEIIQDCSDVIRFFNSGEYRKYKNASYIVRSYGDDQDFSVYTDIRSLRLFAGVGKLRFVGEVHENITPLEAPTKFLDCIADHYGYMYRSGGKLLDLAYDKARRNLDILFRILEKEKEPTPNTYNQIADCYLIIEEWEKAEQYVDMGLDLVDKNRIEYIQYFLQKISLLSRVDKFNEILEIGSLYFDPVKNPARTSELASDCYIYMMCAYAHYKLKNYKKAINQYTAFFNTYRKYIKGKLNTIDLLVDVFRVDNSALKFAYDIFFRCCYQEKAFEPASGYTKGIPLDTYQDDESFMANHLNIRVEMMNSIGYNEFDYLYRQLDEKWQKHLLIRVRINIFTVNGQNRATIIRKLSAFGEMPAALSKIYNAYFEKKSADKELIEGFLKKYGSEDSEDILYILLDTHSDITPFLETADFFADRAVQLIIVKYENSVKLFEDYDIGNISDEGIAAAVNFYGWAMLRAMEKGFKISKLFETYAALGENYLEAFEDKGGNVPGDVRAALLVRNVVTAKKAGNPTAANAAVKKLTEIVPDLLLVVDAYQDENPEVFRAAAKSADPEFAALAAQVKQNIRDLISAGDTENSRALLKEFEDICPEDPDINELQDEINNLLQ